MTVIHDYRGFRIEVDAIPADGCWNAEVRLRRILTQDKPHVETVACYKLTAKHAEWSGELWARRWIDAKGGRVMAPQQFQQVAEETARAIRSLRQAAEGLAAKLTAIEADLQPNSEMALRLGTLVYGGIKLMDTTQAAATLERAITRGRQRLEATLLELK